MGPSPLLRGSAAGGPKQAWPPFVTFWLRTEVRNKDWSLYRLQTNRVERYNLAVPASDYGSVVTFRLDERQYRALLEYAMEQGSALSSFKPNAVARELVLEGLERNGRPGTLFSLREEPGTPAVGRPHLTLASAFAARRALWIEGEAEVRVFDDEGGEWIEEEFDVKRGRDYFLNLATGRRVPLESAHRPLF